MTDIYDFGASPYTSNNFSDEFDDFDEILGGDVTYKSNKYMQYILIGLLIIVAIYLILNIFYKLKIDGEDYNQRQTHKYFNNLHGESYDADAKQAIKYGESIDNPRAIDHYRLGTTYLVNANNPHKAHEHFRKALDQIIEGAVDLREVPFIIDRIDDYKDQFVDFPEIEELPIQQAILTHYEVQNRLNQNMERKKADIKDDDPELTQKILLARQEWESDSQNVHDTAIRDELQQQLVRVRDENSTIPNINQKDYSDVTNWLKIRYRDDPSNLKKINKILNFLNQNYPLRHAPEFTERDILVNVWRRAYDPGNRERFDEIREAIGNALLDCIEGDAVVCADGRISKIWQCLATLDKDPEVGILKSKQALRNEIYERSAKIVSDHVGENGSASIALKEAYINGENTEQVKELAECMKQQIKELRGEYEHLLPKERLDLILEECLAVI